LSRHAAKPAPPPRAAPAAVMPLAISAVIPAYNEERTLADVVHRTRAVLETVATDWEIVIVDDASADSTPAIIAALETELGPRLRAHRHEHNRGIAATFEELYQLARLEWVILVSGDGQYPPEAIAEAAKLTDAYDVVVCNRTRKPYGAYRALLSWGYRALPRALFGVDLYDSGSIKLVRREIYRAIAVDSLSVFAEAERIIRAARQGYRIGKVDIEQAPRTGGLARGAATGTVAGAVRDMLALWWRL
jgi:dolichol-phosphate mannosyltransferase